MCSRWKSRSGKETSHWFAKASSRWLVFGMVSSQERDAVRQDGSGVWIARPVGMAQGQHPQQRSYRTRIGLEQIVSLCSKGSLQQPQQLFVGLGSELVGLAKAQLRWCAALEQQPVIQEQGKAGEGQWRLACAQIIHGGMKLRDRV
jgi:hypothetical protein